ncbi:hypothetical protein HKD37_02G003736 [Glycine soja]
MICILGQHGWVARITRKSLRLILNSLCVGVCRSVCPSVSYVTSCHGLIRIYVNLNRSSISLCHKDHWLIVHNSDRYSLPACGCGRPSTLQSIIGIITISFAHTSASNVT